MRFRDAFTYTLTVCAGQLLSNAVHHSSTLAWYLRCCVPCCATPVWVWRRQAKSGSPWSPSSSLRRRLSRPAEAACRGTGSIISHHLCCDSFLEEGRLCEAAFVTLQSDVVAGAREPTQGRDACMSCREWGASCSVFALPCHALVDMRLCSRSSKPHLCNRPIWFDLPRFLRELCHAVKPCQTPSGGGQK